MDELKNCPFEQAQDDYNWDAQQQEIGRLKTTNIELFGVVGELVDMLEQYAETGIETIYNNKPLFVKFCKETKSNIAKLEDK